MNRRTFALAQYGSGISGASWRRAHRNRRFICSGEYRAPKGGEFYLSGAIPEVYIAHADGITAAYHIVREVLS